MSSLTVLVYGFTFVFFFYDLQTNKSITTVAGPLLQPEVRLFKRPFSIFIHAAYTRSSYTYKCFTQRFPQVHAAQILHFAKGSFTVNFYRLKMLFDRDTIKCFNNNIPEYLDKYQNKPRQLVSRRVHRQARK